MIENIAADIIVNLGLVALVLLLLPTGYRALRGPDVADRLLAIDLITTILTGIIVLVALVEGIGFLVDIGIALAALSFIGTLGIVRYVVQQEVF